MALYLDPVGQVGRSSPGRALCRLGAGLLRSPGLEEKCATCQRDPSSLQKGCLEPYLRLMVKILHDTRHAILPCVRGFGYPKSCRIVVSNSRKPSSSNLWRAIPQK